MHAICADIRPPHPDGIILKVATLSSSGAGWRPCPAEFRCGVSEFSRAAGLLADGCAGVSACRVWRLAEGDGEASDVIWVTYQRVDTTCLNCPPGLDYETAHRQWEKAREAAGSRCPAVEDSR